MRQSELENFLINNLPRAILLYGESEFYISYYSNLIKNKISKNPNLILNPEHVDIITHISMGNLFYDANIVIKKMYEAMSKSEFEEICFYLSKNKNSYLIIELYKSLSKSDSDYSKIYKSFSSFFNSEYLSKKKINLQNVIEIRCFHPSPKEKIDFLYKKAKYLKLNINHELLSQILILQNFNLEIALNELEKLIYYNEIDINLINELCNSNSSHIELIFDFLFLKNHNLMNILNSLFDKGISNNDILMNVNRYFNILFKLNLYSRVFGTSNPKISLGFLPPFQILEIWNKRSLKLSNNQFIQIFDCLNEWRLDLIHGKSDTSITFLIKLQNIL